MFSTVTAIISMLLGFAAAILWLRSAWVKTPRSFSVNVISCHTANGDVEGSEVLSQGFGTSDELTALGNALIRQSRFSSWGAGCAALSILFQLASFLASYPSLN